MPESNIRVVLALTFGYHACYNLGGIWRFYSIGENFSSSLFRAGLSTISDDVIIVTSSLTKDMTGKEDSYRAAAIRFGNYPADDYFLSGPFFTST